MKHHLTQVIYGEIEFSIDNSGNMTGFVDGNLINEPDRLDPRDSGDPLKIRGLVQKRTESVYCIGIEEWDYEAVWVGEFKPPFGFINGVEWKVNRLTPRYARGNLNS